jgi:hypothetical protein
MDKEIQESGPMASLASSTIKSHKTQSRSGFSFATFLLAIAIIVVAGLWYKQNYLGGFEKEWQAVFLSNGQVYFGKIAKNNRAEIKLKDIYYLQVTQPLQQTEETTTDANAKQGELSLVKLGSELHGPTDVMTINRDHVLFIEDIKDDSNVVQAINNYKAGQ